LSHEPTLIPTYEVVEKFMDGLCTVSEVRRYWLHPGEESQCSWPERPSEWALDFAECSMNLDEEIREGFPMPDELLPILRDIFGNPFRPITINPAWLSWNEGTIPKIAQAIYDERAFDRMPILADALEEAGCTNADILSHCRQPGEHVRGCWVVDLILGKE
jgi:hypothetical protein